MTEATALVGLGWVEDLMKDLVNKSISYLGSNITRGLEDLETTLLPQFQLTIEAAQHSPHKDRLAKWLARLKNAYYDAEGILHDLEYERLKSMAKGNDESLLVRLSSKPFLKPLVKFTNRAVKKASLLSPRKTTLFKPVNKFKPLANLIGQVVEKASLLSPRKRELLQRLNELKEITEEAKTFRDLLNIHNIESNYGVIASNSRSVTTRFLPVNDQVFGRDGVRDEIINFLFDEQGDSSLTRRYSVTAVTGMGGAGKTTLAQYVYNDPRVTRHFRVRMWLCLSQNVDIFHLTKEMIECVTGKEPPNLRNLSRLQEMLVETLPGSGNIMIVLDDVWYDREAGDNPWEDLLKPFATQEGICKIMVTSRSTSFPVALQPGKLIQLSDLAPDDFISLLRYRAIVGLQISDPQLKNDLSDIVDQIAKKMCKSPLAAKVVGNQLRRRPDITFWQNVLEKTDLSDTMETLLWSFHRFDVQLQRCFLFCSIWPKGTRFNLYALFYEIVYHWVALDFIQPSYGNNRNVEDIGMEYLKIMIENYILQRVDNNYGVDNIYIMHDLFHDLAEKLSVEDCFRVTSDEREIPSTVQHVYVIFNNENLKDNLSRICNLSNLRTLILESLFVDDISEIILEISTNCRNLRALTIWCSRCKTLPKHVGDLRNLRFLNFRRTSIEELPDSVLQLYHLQFLILPFSVNTFPTKLSNLIKLRYIDIYTKMIHKVNTLPPIPYLGKLTSLQQLNEFHVRKEKGYELHQLGCLKEIGGSLRIKNLENVSDKNEANAARLIDKSKLERLELVWAESAENNGLEMEIIEALRPPAKLEFLKIYGYRGSTYPTWFQEGSFMNNIKGVGFYNCQSLTIVLQNFHQFHHCSELDLQNLGALRELPTIPENLARLSIINCPCLIFVCENELQVNENQSIIESRFLKFGIDDLGILDHELKSFEQTVSVENFAEQFRKIKKAAQGNEPELLRDVNRAWWCCHQQRMNFIFRCNTRAKKLELPSMLRALNLASCCVSDGALLDCLRGTTALEELYLCGIMTITTLPPTQVLESLQGLRVLHIRNCWYLRSLGGLHALPHLENFLVDHCWCLDMASGSTSIRLPSTLQSFTISTCEVAQAIFNGNLSCLQIVQIRNCIVPSTLSFSQLTLLKSLEVFKCPNLSSICGLESRPLINTLCLVLLPNLVVESVLESWQGCRELRISSLVMLNKLLSFKDFVPPRELVIQFCKEETISFEECDHLQSIKRLWFLACSTRNLPTTLSAFSTLEAIVFKNCPEISELPELPSSVELISISDCPVLKERCQPNGLDWHKIQGLFTRIIE